ncbi:hypothetical protein QYZ87_03455 [Porphyromonadaceae bacterium W3.11]|nr:hypothetical protein [Porphyromonadaceae bacterium W3.11]
MLCETFILVADDREANRSEEEKEAELKYMSPVASLQDKTKPNGYTEYLV